jgi:hypothetical protein
VSALVVSHDPRSKKNASSTVIEGSSERNPPIIWKNEGDGWNQAAAGFGVHHCLCRKKVLNVATRHITIPSVEVVGTALLNCLTRDKETRNAQGDENYEPPEKADP